MSAVIIKDLVGGPYLIPVANIAFVEIDSDGRPIVVLRASTLPSRIPAAETFERIQTLLACAYSRSGVFYYDSEGSNDVTIVRVPVGIR